MSAAPGHRTPIRAWPYRMVNRAVSGGLAVKLAGTARHVILVM